MSVAPADVVGFWTAAGQDAWYRKDEAFDADIRRRFGATRDAAAAGALDGWAATREGALALLLLLDQFSRNLFRGSAQAFAADPKARRIADAAMGRGFDLATPQPLRQFFYLPLMHSEALADQQRCVALCTAYSPDNLRYAVLHRDLVARFGRFPHRNAVLGRAPTEAEAAYLASADAFKG